MHNEVCRLFANYRRRRREIETKEESKTLLLSQKLPVLIWLSGLTCNEQNFIQKSGFQKYASEHKLIVVCPDTSPRGCNIEGEADRWDFGVGAGFYVDATESKWAANFRMYSYVNKEMHQIIRENFSPSEKMSISGHSMGGHGALVGFLRNPSKYKSVSAFAPICAPCQCDWGKQAFTGYLGAENKKQWEEYDATALVKSFQKEGNDETIKILIDQGTEDGFLKQNQLCPELLVDAAKGSKVNVNSRMQQGYDHSYFFIASFIQEHIEFHAKHLK